jgi:hypothetical protein
MRELGPVEAGFAALRLLHAGSWVDGGARHRSTSIEQKERYYEDAAWRRNPAFMLGG